MTFRAYFKHMPTSMAAYAYAEKKLGRQLDKYGLRINEAHVTFWVEHGAFRVNCHVVADGGIDLAMGAEDPQSMFAAIDVLEDKIEAGLRKAKGKLRRYAGHPLQADAIQAAADGEPAIDAVDAAEILEYEQQHGRPALRLVATTH